MEEQINTDSGVLVDQVREAEVEHDRFDHEEIQGEYIEQVRVVRKRHRKNAQCTGLESDSDIDEEFKMGVIEAANKFGYKRKKKHLFNDAGIPIEPFNIRDDVKSGLLTEDGFLKRSLQ